MEKMSDCFLNRTSLVNCYYAQKEYGFPFAAHGQLQLYVL